MSLYFSAVNRNKRSVALDLKHPQGRDILLQLAKQADVVYVQLHYIISITALTLTESTTLSLARWTSFKSAMPFYQPTIPKSYTPAYPVRPTRNAMVLLLSDFTGYGKTGPYAQRAGYDLIAGAEAGLLHITGEIHGRPLKPGLGLTDMCTGLYTHGAILAALRSRDVTGNGQSIDTSLFETQISLMSNVAMSWLNLGQEAQRWGNGHPTIAPYDSFETKDSHIVVGAVNDRQYKKLCILLDCAELAEAEEYATNPDRVLHREELTRQLQTRFKTRTTDEWCAAFEGSGMPYGPINTVEKAFQHPQVEARDAVARVEDERAVAGYIKALSKFSITTEISEKRKRKKRGAKRELACTKLFSEIANDKTCRPCC